MFSIALFGANQVDGSMVAPGDRLVSLALFGGIELDFASTEPPPAVELVVIAIFGGVRLRVRPEQAIHLSGFSLFGERRVDRRVLPAPDDGPPESPDDFDLPLDVSAYALFGGVKIERVSPDSGALPGLVSRV